ncbi:MAG: anti-sigma F factor [Clostridia bacterium]
MDNYLKMQIPSLGKNESFARSVVAAFALDCEPTVEEINDLKTAISEAVTNAVVHAYGDNAEGVIDISATIVGRSITVTVADYGCGIENVDVAREPFYTTKQDEERSGMGFTIMETFMDEMQVVSKVGGGTTVTMKKVFK